MRKKNDLTLDRIEIAIADLKVQYDIFFNGGADQWPESAHEELQREIDRAMNIQSLDYAQRFRLNSLASRLSAFGELWRRNIVRLEQGRKPAYGTRKGRFDNNS